MKGTMVITCEHAGNEVPGQFKSLFEGYDDILRSHRGWDPGAFEVSELLSAEFNALFFYTPVSRLLVEANRSLDSHQLFSEFTETLSAADKNFILKTYYHPYRSKVEAEISRLDKPVHHFSIHSFTPVLNGNVRTTDIGLLFDPSRKEEEKLCSHLQQKLKNVFPEFNIDFNMPYLGTDDGFTTYLRTKFSDDNYMGIEIEINQKHVAHANWNAIKLKFLQALAF